jgi:hypothetical protein
VKKKAIAVAVSLAAALITPVTAAGSASADIDDYHVVNAPDGVFWRSAPSWDATTRTPGYGAYDDDNVVLECSAWGTPVGPFGNDLWYVVLDLSRTDSEGNHPEGWINDHFLDTPDTAANPQGFDLFPLSDSCSL